MDPKLVYWTAALANLGVIVACGALGVAAIRRGEVRRHRRMMLAATLLVGLFFASYAGKVVLLGKEDRSAWGAFDYAILYAHELCITLMLLAGFAALYQAWRFRRELPADGSLPNDSGSEPRRALHRRAGLLAKGSGLFAFLTAIGVWLGMLLRI